MKFVEYFDGMFMYGNFVSSGDGDEWVYVPIVILEYGYEWVIFVVFVFKGMLGESIMAIC